MGQLHPEAEIEKSSMMSTSRNQRRCFPDFIWRRTPPPNHFGPPESIKHIKYRSGVVSPLRSSWTSLRSKNEKIRPRSGSFPLSVPRYFTISEREASRVPEGEEVRWFSAAAAAACCWDQHGRSHRPSSGLTSHAPPPPTCGRLQVSQSGRRPPSAKHAVRCEGCWLLAVLCPPHSSSLEWHTGSFRDVTTIVHTSSISLSWRFLNQVSTVALKCKTQRQFSKQGLRVNAWLTKSYTTAYLTATEMRYGTNPVPFKRDAPFYW